MCICFLNVVKQGFSEGRGDIVDIVTDCFFNFINNVFVAEQMAIDEGGMVAYSAEVHGFVAVGGLQNEYGQLIVECDNLFV